MRFTLLGPGISGRYPSIGRLVVSILAVGVIGVLHGCMGCGSKGPDSSGPSSGDRSPPAKQREPAAKLTAINLFDEYGKNPLAADKKYKGQRVDISGSGIVDRDEKGRAYFGFQVFWFPGMTKSQIATLTPREREWFRKGSPPPNVIAFLNARGEFAASEYKPGQDVRITGTVLGSRKADVMRDYVVELDDCLFELVVTKEPQSGKRAMSGSADSKEEPKEKVARGITFNEKVTVRVWVERQKMFANPYEGVWAHRRQDPKLGLIIDVLGASVATSIPTKGSELTDKDGNVYTCEDVEGDHPSTCFVKLKQAAKKP